MISTIEGVLQWRVRRSRQVEGDPLQLTPPPRAAVLRLAWRCPASACSPGFRLLSSRGLVPPLIRVYTVDG
eukprot:770803-Alexandrium_andersonii.AAC.1